MDYKKCEKPFDHWVIDNFFKKKDADILSDQFLEFDDDRWYTYSNSIENKKTLQNWGSFPPKIYQTLQGFCSQEFISGIEIITNIDKLYPDYGLHGG